MKTFNMIEKIEDKEGFERVLYDDLQRVVKVQYSKTRLHIDNNYSIIRYENNDKLYYIHIGTGEYDEKKHLRMKKSPNWYVFKICVYKIETPLEIKNEVAL